MITESSGKSLSVDLCELVVMAFTRTGYSRKEAAGLMGMKESQFSKAFSMNYPDQNTALKKLSENPGGVLKEFAALLADAVGLSVGIDSAKVEASVRVADAVINLMKVSAR